MFANHDTVLAARRRIFAAAAAAVFASVTSAADKLTSDAEAFSRIGASFPVVEFHNDNSAAASTWTRASGFASVLAGEEVRAVSTMMQSAASHGQAQFQVRTQGSVRYLVDAPRAQNAVYTDPLASDADVAAMAMASTVASDRLERIKVIVDNDRRDLLAINGAVADDFRSRWDVGPERARSIFESTIQSLSSNNLVAKEGLALDAVRTHRLMQGERAFGKPAVTRVKEYLFEIPHAVGGIEIFGASTRLAVHRSGQLASIRTTGPSATVSPTRAMVTRLVSTEALTQRASLEHPNAKIVPVGLRYPWQATSDAALAARPREVFQVIPTTQVDGHSVNGRAHFIFYSVEDERMAPLVWPEPNPSATGDVKR